MRVSLGEAKMTLMFVKNNCPLFTTLLTRNPPEPVTIPTVMPYFWHSADGRRSVECMRGL